MNTINPAGTIAMKRAVLIGINAYPHFSKLDGCENDARSMEELLREQFWFDSTKLLLSADATRENILAAFDQLVLDTGPDDAAVIYFAGHGSQIPDREGDEPSGFDSTLLPVDTARDAARPELMREITDDEIFLFLQKLGNKTKSITMIVDACHSGTITRDALEAAGLGNVRGVPPDTRAPSTPSPIPPELWPVLRGDSTAATAVDGWKPVRDHYVMISGSRDNELSGELIANNADGSTTHHGVLTYWLMQALANTQSGATYRSIFETVAPTVATFRQGKQHPQIEGRIDRELFGMKELPPMRYVRVSEVAADGNSIKLAAGTALGFTTGTVVALYDAGTVNTEGKTPLAIGDVTEVRALDSTATIRADGRTGAISTSVRGVVQSAGLADVRRTVQIVAGANSGVPVDAEARLRVAIAASAVLRLVDAPTFDTLTVKAWPSSRSQSAIRWAVTGADGTPVTPLKEISDVASVVRNLEILARQGLALALTNTDANSVLSRTRPKLELLYAYGSEQFRPATPASGGLPEFHEGVKLGVRVTNTHTAPVFLSLLDFGLSGKVTPMYPPKGANEALAAGKTVDLLVREGEQWEFWLPENYPYGPDEALPVRDEGIETIKLFATTSPASFEFLEEAEGVRSGDGSIAYIEQFFRDRVGKSPATREGRPVAATVAPALDDWTTVIAPFVMRRKDTLPLPTHVTRRLATELGVVQQSVPVPPNAVAGTSVVTLPAPESGFAQVLVTASADDSISWQLPDANAVGPQLRYTVAGSVSIVKSRAAYVFPVDASGALSASTVAALDALRTPIIHEPVPVSSPAVSSDAQPLANTGN